MTILERVNPRLRRVCGVCGVTAFSIVGAVASCSTDVKPRGQLMVAVSTDLSIVKDMDLMQLEVFGEDGSPLTSYSYDIRGVGLDGTTLVDGLRMPGTIAVVPPNSGGERVRIRVTAKSTIGGTDTPRIVREAILKIPEDRVALLQMPLRWLCKEELVPSDTPQAYESTCYSHDHHTTCGAGDCVGADVDTNALPDYSPEKVFGGGDANGKGSTCIDVPSCFGNEPTVDLRKSDCTVALPANAHLASLNVAMVLKPGSDGHCLDTADGPKTGKCYLPIDVDSEEAPVSDAALSESVHEGFLVRGDRIYLPKAVCDRNLVQGVAVSLSCKTKDLSIPVCGPWTGWPQTLPPLPEGGPPPDASTGGSGGGGGTGAGGAQTGGAGGNGGTDGGPDGGPQFCTADAALAPAYYYVFVDRNATVAQSVQPINAAVHAFAAESQSATLHFGLQLSSQQQACSPDYSTPVFPFQVLAGAGLNIPIIQPAPFPNVLLDSAMGQSLVTVEAPPGPASRTLVVITGAHDDQPNGCGTSTDLMKQTVSKALADGVSLRPIVVADQLPANLLQGFQGTGTPQPVQLAANAGQQQLVAELDKYRDEIARCTYVTPAKSYTVQLAGDAADGKTIPLTSVAGATACTSGTQYYEPAPGTFTLCPATCTAAAAARVQTTVQLEPGVDAAACISNGTAGSTGGAPGAGGRPAQGGSAGSGAAPNCGSCSGTCTQFGCAVNIFNAAPSNGPNSFASDAQNLYYTTSGGFVRVLAKTGTTNAILASGEQVPGAIAVDSQSAYWTTANAIRKAPISGAGGGTGATTVANAPGPTALAVDPSNVYFVAGNGVVFSEPLAGGPQPTQVATAQTSMYPSIAVDATNVYWTALTGVNRAPLGGGTATPTWQNGKLFTAVALAPSKLVVASDTGVFTVNPDGSSPVSLSNTGTQNKAAIQVASGYAYFIARGSVYRVPLGGGATDQLATQVTDGVLAADNTAVFYYTTQGNIVRLAFSKQ